MPDIKKFTGFIAPDGTTHSSIKAATDHTRDLKIKAALLGIADSFDPHSVGVGVDSEGNSVLQQGGIADYLFAHKDAITAAFNPEVTTRKKRVPGAKTVGSAKRSKAADAGSKPVENIAADQVSNHPGVLNLEYEDAL